MFAEAFRNGAGAYKAVFHPAAVDQGRLDAIHGRLKEIEAMPLSSGGRSGRSSVLQKEESETPRGGAGEEELVGRTNDAGVAAFVVPLNMLFGIAAAWAVTKFHVQGTVAPGVGDRFAVFGVASDRGVDLRVAVRGARVFGGVGEVGESRGVAPAVRALPWSLCH